MKKNPDRQDKIYRFILNCKWTRGITPTLREIADGCNINSLGTVRHYLRNLMANGLIRFEDNKAERKIVVIDKPQTVESKISEVMEDPIGHMRL